MNGAIRIGIVTISDRAFGGQYEDRGGPAIEAALNEMLASGWEPVKRLIPDEQERIEGTLKALADDEGCSLIVTTGGTGPAVRDVTPEATLSVCDKVYPGFGEAMRAESLKTVPTAILSRQMAGSRGKTLIVNLPGQPQAIRLCLHVIMPAVPYCIELLGGPRLETNERVLKSFRPQDKT